MRKCLWSIYGEWLFLEFTSGAKTDSSMIIQVHRDILGTLDTGSGWGYTTNTVQRNTVQIVQYIVNGTAQHSTAQYSIKSALHQHSTAQYSTKSAVHCNWHSSTQYSTVQYKKCSTVQHSTVKEGALHQHSTAQYSTKSAVHCKWHSATQYSTVQYKKCSTPTQYSTVLYKEWSTL